VDDLESCFWVSAWSAFFNEDNAGDQLMEESDLKDDLIKNNKSKTSNIVQRFRPILLEWWRRPESSVV